MIFDGENPLWATSATTDFTRLVLQSKLSFCARSAAELTSVGCEGMWIHPLNHTLMTAAESQWGREKRNFGTLIKKVNLLNNMVNFCDVNVLTKITRQCLYAIVTAITQVNHDLLRKRYSGRLKDI